MARIAGRRGRLYMSTSASGTAAPLGDVTSWTINYAQPTIETTAMGDSTRQYVADLADAGGSFDGLFNTTTPSAVQAAAVSGEAVRFYLYPDTSTSTIYHWGTLVIESYEQTGGVGNAVTENVSWKAGSDIAFKTT